jgi:hypothetical protein
MNCPVCSFVNNLDLNQCESCEQSLVYDIVTEGIIEALFEAIPQNVVLCNPYTAHFAQNGSYGAKWSCGYRNIQMLCSSLMKYPMYREKLFNGSANIPSILGLQYWIEKAWQHGFDREVCIL